MRSLITIVLISLSLSALSQVKISEMTTTSADPTGGWIPVVLSGSNYKIDAGKFYNKLDSIYRKSGTDSIFTIRNGVQQFAFKDTCSCCEEGPFIPQKTIAELRALSPDPFANKVYYIIDENRQGMFKYDGAGTSADDDGIMTIVTTNNKKFKRVVDDHINVKWFGAVGKYAGTKISDVYTDKSVAVSLFSKYTGGTITETDCDNQTIDWFALQVGIGYCIREYDDPTGKNFKKLYVPAGKYILSRPLIGYYWKESKYEQCTFTIEGESSFWGGIGGTFFYTAFPASPGSSKIENFAIGVQCGKGVKIKNISFWGQFTHTGVISNRDFYASTLDNFTALYNNNCADKRYAPYSAIVIDPFRDQELTSTELSSQQYYNDLSDFYRTYANGGGSTGTEIEDVQIFNFVSGIVFSPNGKVQNNEFSRLEKIQINYVKVGLAICQPQEKTNIIRHLAAWNDVHTVISAHSYGEQKTGQWSAEDINLAGRVNQFIDRDEHHYFPMFIRNFFSESLGKLGRLASEVSGSFEDSEIGFAYPLETRQSPPGTPDQNSYFFLNKWQIEGGGYTFKNCNIRFYGTNIPVTIKGGFRFENCSFETVPYTFIDRGNVFTISTFSNCRTYLEGQFGTTDIRAEYPNYFNRYVAYGKFILRDYFYESSAHRVQFQYENYLPFRQVGKYTTTVVNTDAYGVGEIYVPQDKFDQYYKFSKMVLVYKDLGSEGVGYFPLGAIVSYNSSTHYLKISGIRSEFINTEVQITCPLPVTTVSPFLGDIIQGESNKISNIRLDYGSGFYYGSSNPANLIGKVVLLKDIPASNQYDYGDYTVIYDYDLTHNTFLAADLYVNRSSSSVYFCNGCQKLRDQKPLGTVADGEQFQYGSTATLIPDNIPRKYTVSKSGLYNASAISGETRQAEFVPAVNFNSHADARFYGSSNIYFTSVSDANSKIAAIDRRRGMSVFVLNGTDIEEYWYRDDVNNSDLVLKYPASGTIKINSDLSAVSSTSNNTATGLSFSVASGGTYKFRFVVVFSTAATTTGLRLGITSPSTTILSANVSIPNGADGTNTIFSGWVTSSGDVVISEAVEVANTNYIAVIEGTITTSSAGTVQLVYGSEVSGSNVQIKQSSYVRYEKY